MEIILYGILTDVAGSNNVSPQGITTTDQLRQKMLELYPAIAGIPYAMAVNDQIVRNNITLQKYDTVSLLPPFSGG
jgi:sulfur-carrier protein